jgi:hypothetical protein
VVNVAVVNRVSFNGGAGGIHAVPTPQERAFAQERHIAATQEQRQHTQEAARNPGLAARANGGHPAVAATPRPGAFNGPGVVGAHGAAARPGSAPPSGARPNPNNARQQPGRQQPQQAGRQQQPANQQRPKSQKEEGHHEPENR